MAKTKRVTFSDAAPVTVEARDSSGSSASSFAERVGWTTGNEANKSGGAARAAGTGGLGPLEHELLGGVLPFSDSDLSSDEAAGVPPASKPANRLLLPPSVAPALKELDQPLSGLAIAPGEKRQLLKQLQQHHPSSRPKMRSPQPFAGAKRMRYLPLTGIRGHGLKTPVSVHWPHLNYGLGYACMRWICM